MLLLCIFGFVLLASRVPQETPPSEQAWMATITEQDNAEATEIHDIILNFRPVVIGDPITGAEYRYFPKSACWTCFGLTAIVCAAASWFMMKKRHRRASCKKQTAVIVSCTILPACLAYAMGYAASYYFGGPYNYENYAVPTEACDVLIWFSGSDDGAYFMDNYARSIREFGYDRAALFNFRDMTQALQFAEKLPDGCRIIVRGHSMGAAAAAHFCQKCNREILMLDTRDSTSWFNHLKSKPSNVIHWRNVLPSEPFLRTPESRHMDTFYFCGFNMANVFRWLGGPWGLRDGAVNLMPSACDHHDVGEAID
ncbi:MAG: hypothetical protein IKZ46_09825 [Victivallales bacterium]|nr:hypothetical protein [Victivallales bacterium]